MDILARSNLSADLSPLGISRRRSFGHEDESSGRVARYTQREGQDHYTLVSHPHPRNKTP